MLSSPAVGASAETLRRFIEQGRLEAKRRGRPLLVSYALPVDHLDLFHFYRAACALSPDRFLWVTPRGERAMAGLGIALSLEGRGDARFREIEEAWSRVAGDAVIAAHEDSAASGPLLFGGFAFRPLPQAADVWNGYPDARFVVPEITFFRSATGTSMAVNARVGPEDDPDAAAERLSRLVLSAVRPQPNAAPASARQAGPSAPADLPPSEPKEGERDAWQAAVRALVGDIREGRFEKAVLARTMRVERPGGFSEADVLSRLAAAYPECTVFSVAWNGRAFVGASPELLVRLEGSRVESMALASTAARGKTPAEDEALGAALLASAKDRAEHAMVAEHVTSRLAPFCEEVSAPVAPGLLKFTHVQHLYTPVTGRLAAPASVLRLAEALHPTPAVGGRPLALALEAIAEREPFERGWYTGAVGLLDAAGEGEFAVAIRSALLDPDGATLFAGCGIVAGSEPEKEYEESCLKLRPMQSVLAQSAG